MGQQYIGNDLLELTKHMGGNQTNLRFSASMGHITSVDADKCLAKVMLQPDNIETGWIQIGTLYAGADFGLVALPADGTECLVVFENGNINSGRIVLCNWNDTDYPPTGINQGEVVMIHSSGSYLKFLNTGNVELSPASSLLLAGGGEAVARVGDTCTCPVSSGTITSGSSKVTCG